MFFVFAANDRRGHQRNDYDDLVRAKIVAMLERRDRALRSIILFRLLLLRQSHEIGLALNARITNPDSIIVRVGSTVCNHGPVCVDA